MSSTTDFVPEQPDQLTSDWLSQALDFDIAAVTSETLGEGQGFMGDILRLHLSCDDPGCPSTVIAKMPKLANRAMGEMMGLYEREVLFFETLGQAVPSRIPQIYYAHQDRDAGSEQQKTILAKLDKFPRLLLPLISIMGKKVAASKKRRYLLLMEDLAQFSPGDQFAGAPVETCRAVLMEIAQTHRQHWRSTALDDYFWLLPLDIEARMRHQMLLPTIPAFHELLPDGMRGHLEWIATNGVTLMRQFCAQAPATLLHCDLRLDNICFNGEQVAFLDWQLTRSGPAAYDVAYFLGSALDPEVSTDEEFGILQDYHQALAVPDYPFEVFVRDYDRALMLTLPALMPTADIAIDAGRGQEMMQRWRERVSARLRRLSLDRLLD